MSEAKIDRVVAELLVQLGRLAYSGGHRSKLTDAQWAALRYFGRANRFSRTTSGFAEFHCTTRGTASQTVKALTERGYLSRTRSPLDGRSVWITLTSRGEQLLAQDPIEDVTYAVAALPAGTRSRLATGLSRVISRLALERGTREFGTCFSCRHLRRSELETPGSDHRCRRYDQSLEDSELNQICVNFDRQD